MCVTNFGAVGGREFVVKHLVFRNDAMNFHAGEVPAPGKDHFSFGPVFHGFDP